MHNVNLCNEKNLASEDKKDIYYTSMAAQPKKKISKVRSKTRRAHQSIKLPVLTICPNCKHLKPPHIACPKCGFYGAKKILITKTDRRIAKQLKQEKPKTAKTDKEEPPAKEDKPSK